MLTGKPPYSDLMTMAAMYQIVEKDMLIPPSVTPQLYDLLSSCFAKDPEQRPTADQLCGHEWLSMSHIASFKAQDSLPFFQRRQSHDPRYEIGSSGESTTPGLDYSGSSFESSSLNTHFGGPGSPLYSPSHFGADLPDRTQRASSSDDSSFSGQSPSSINKARRTTLDMIVGLKLSA